ncbi:MAG: hypothetical protein ACO391_13670, partial [Pseudomonadales bacterium]
VNSTLMLAPAPKISTHAIARLHFFLLGLPFNLPNEPPYRLRVAGRFESIFLAARCYLYDR